MRPFVPDTGSVIEYASDSLEQPADRLLRHVVGWAALVYGGAALIRTTLHIALAHGWVASPNSMRWGMGSGLDQLLLAAQTLAMAGLVLGGVLLLRRSRVSIPIVRACVACAIVLAVVILVTDLRSSAVGASYWSTPAAAGTRALEFLKDLWLPIVIVLLTLPPLARRMV